MSTSPPDDAGHLSPGHTMGVAGGGLAYPAIRQAVAEGPHGAAILASEQEAHGMPRLHVVPEKLVAMVKWLQQSPGLYFDMLHCITGIDHGPEAKHMEVVYNLESVLLGHKLCLYILLERDKPSAPSLCSLYGSANWLEREAYDLLGIYFEGHPDLRRLLLPADWEGHPLRKDYIAQAYYRGIKVAYRRDDEMEGKPDL